MHSPLPPATQHSRPERPQGMARSNRPEGLARQQAWRCRILHSEPMVISDALHARRQDADRQQSPGARYQNLCHWQKELAVQRQRRGSQGQCRRLQSDANLPRLTRRAVSLVAPRPHRIASARGRRRYYRPAALQLPQNRRCLNGSDAALDTKAIRQKRGRHRGEKIALTFIKLEEFGTGALPGSLRHGQYSYGVAQKLLNLVLEYHWCLGQISEPSHCPTIGSSSRTLTCVGASIGPRSLTRSNIARVIEAVRRNAEPESIAR